MKGQNEGLNSHSNTRDIIIDQQHFLELMHIHDSAFPIGGYTQSFGLETYIQRDLVFNQRTLLEWCRVYLYENLGFGDGILVQEAMSFPNESIEKLQLLDQLCHGMKIAKESRQGSLKMGRQFLQAVVPLTTHPSFSLWNKLVREELVYGHYPITYGLYCYCHTFNKEAALLSFLYSSTASLVHNAVRAIPLGQSAGVQAIHQLLPDCLGVAQAIQKRTIQDLSNQAVGIELASMEHEHLFSRLFIS